jgi:hypothetical protein
MQNYTIVIVYQQDKKYKKKVGKQGKKKIKDVFQHLSSSSL